MTFSTFWGLAAVIASGAVDSAPSHISVAITEVDKHF